MANPKPSPCVENSHNPNNSGVVADFPNYEGFGTTVNDVSGNGNNGTLTSSGQWASGGPYGEYLTFDGVTQYMQATAVASGFTSVTLCCSAKMTGTSSSYPVVFGIDFDTGQGFRINQTPISDNSKVYSEIHGSGGTVQCYSTVPANNGTDGTWHRFASVFDGVAGQIRLYVDGVLVASQSGSWGTATPLDLLKIGARGTNYWAGSFDGGVQYSVALTLAQIQQDAADAFARFRAISPIQASTLASVTAATTATTSFGVLPTVGDAIKVSAWGICTSALGAPTVTDNQTGNTYTLVKYSQDSTLASGEFAGEWLLPAVVGSSGTFSVTLTASLNSIINVIAREYNPGLTADQTNSATGNSASPAGGAVTTATANELISATFGSIDTANPATITPPAGFYLYGQQLSGVTSGVGGTSDEVVSTTQTSLNPTYALNGSYKWSGVTATYFVGTVLPTNTASIFLWT